MDSYEFTVPVRVVATEGAPVLEIFNVEEAVDFLMAWPEERQGPFFQDAFDACFAATVDLVSADNARWILMRFARETGILSKDMAIVIERPGDSAHWPL